MKKFSVIIFGLLLSSFSFAQTPTTVPAVDGEAFPGTQICTEVEFQNTGSPGYGPYLRLTVPAGLSYSGTELFGLPVPSTLVGTFPVAPPHELIDPVTGDVVTGNPGDSFYILKPQIGSVVAGGPPLTFNVCLDIDPTATVNVPLPVSVTPAYEFGDTPTGDNGPIVGTTDDFNITPILVTFEKSSNVPEGERPPGPSWPVSYTLNVDVANNNTIDNIVINDVLPSQFVLDTGSINISGGVNCVSGLPNISITCDSVNGTAAGNDLVITYSGYFDDVLDETACGKDTAVNNATFDAEFNAVAVPQLTDSNNIELEHMSVQKGASPGQVTPGNLVTYNLNIQLSDYANADRVIVTDILPDGVTFNSVLSGGVTPTISNDTPAAGQTTVEFDITSALGTLSAGTGLTISYDASVDQTYANTDAVLASDPLSNTVDLDYDLVEGASACGDDSAATILVAPVAISKDVVSTGPYMPGDTVTYRLSLAVPSGDTNGVVFEDFFPLPVFDATTIDTSLPLPNSSISLDPSDTLGLTPTSITTDAGTNSLTINWPNITTTTPQTLSVLVDVVVTDDPFADNLSLANLLRVSTSNTEAEVSTGITPVLIQVRAPELHMTKGVVSADQGNINPSPAVLPVDGNVTNVDAGDSISYQLTLENVGGAPAYDVVITDPAVASLTACSVSAVTDGNGDVLAYSGSIGTGITLTNPLAANDGTIGAPYGTDTALVTVNCTVASAVEIGSTLTNTATADYASQSGAVNFPSVSDNATATIGQPTMDKTIVSVTPNVDSDNGTITIGEVIQYQVEVTIPEGVSSNAVVTDQLDNGLTFLSFDSIVPSSGDITTDVAGGFAAVLAGASGIGTRDASFNFGTLGNSNTDNNTAETLTITYSVLVNDVGANQNGENKINDASFSSDNGSASDSAPNLTIREPSLGLNKTVSPANADAGDTVTYTIVMTNNGTSPAFDVVISDSLSDPDLNLVAGSVVTSSGTITTGNAGGDTTVQVDVSSVPVGGSVTVTFDVTIDPTAVSGSVLNNVASTIGDSLPGNDPYERDYGPVTDDADVTIAPAEVVKSVLPATSTNQDEASAPSGESDPSLVDLTIGEEVTFNIVATLAEGVSPSVIITDTLPDNATGQMVVTGSELISIGGNLTPTNAWLVGDPGVVSGANNNVVTFDFGSVVNVPDGTVDGNDQIVVQVTALVTNASVNEGIEVLTNTVLIQYDTGADVSGSADIEVVEPNMLVDKAGDVNSADAGDTITYTIEVSNPNATSSADAYDVTMTDMIPAGLTYVGGSLTHDSGLAPDVGPTESGGSISAGWTHFPISETATFTYQVTVDPGVYPEQVITNTADIDWSSLPGTDPNERNNSDSDQHTVTITESGLSKTVLSTSESSTGTSQSGPEDDLTIGEEVTYRMVVTFPEGTSYNAVMTDQLPNTTAVLSVVSSEIISIGGQLTVPGVSTGDAGVHSNTNVDAYDDLITWTLGNVVNTPDGLNNTDDQVVFEVVAVVVNEPVNQGVLNDIANVATLTVTDSSGANPGSVTDSALVDIVEPVVTVTKNTDPATVIASAGETLTYQLTIAHDASSSADAFNFSVTDNLPVPGTEWINDGTVTSTCPAWTVDSSAEPIIEFNFDELPLSPGSCTIRYNVLVNSAVNPSETYANVANMEYTSTPGSEAETRTYSDSDGTSFVTPDPNVLKEAGNSSLSDTGDNIGDPMAPDLAIGETIDFDLTIVVPHGITTGAVVTDNLPVGMEVVNAGSITMGPGISYSGTPLPAAISDSNSDTYNDQVVFDFGDITNVYDGDDTNNWIRMIVTARLLDVAGNTAVDMLTNNVTFEYDTGTPLTDDADVEVVEPNLGLAKSFGTVNDYVVPITLTMNNTGGTAAAYDLVLEDVFDTANIWDENGFSAVTVPTGFTLTVSVDDPVVGSTTIRIESDPLSSPPDSSLEPNEVVNFVFNATLLDDVSVTSIPNTATIEESSSLPGNDPNERDFPPVDGTDTLLLPALDSFKSVVLDDDTNSSGGASPGETLNYTITVVNSGDAPATSVVVTDIPDPNGSLVVGSVTTNVGSVTTGNTGGDTTVVVNVGTLAVDATVTITYQVVINDPLPSGVEELVNQAQITSQEIPDFNSDDPNTPTDPDDPTIIPVDGAPDLTIVKDDGGAITTPGGVVVYTLGYSNNGTQDATGVEITETVPANSTFNAANSDAGWSCVNGDPAGTVCTLNIAGTVPGDGSVSTVNFAVTVVNPLPSGVTELSNSTSITDDGNNGSDLDPSDNNDDDNTPITASPTLEVTKDDGGVTVEPDDVVTYTINYANTGNQDATNVVITETVPMNSIFVDASSSVGWSCADGSPGGTACTQTLATLAAGDSGSLSFAVQVNDPLPAGVTAINNSVAIADDDGNTDNGSDDTPVTATPDLTLVKDDGVVLANPGDTLIYAIAYENVGNQEATGVVITETVPVHTTFNAGSSTGGWSCGGVTAGSVCTYAVGSVAGGSSGLVNFAVNVDNPLAAGATSVVNVASITDDGNNGADPTPSNNSDGDTDSLDGTALDLWVTKDDGGTTVIAGGTVIYTISYGNNGNIGSTGVELSEVVPANSTFDAGNSDPAWSCAGVTAGSSCTLAVGVVAGGAAGSVAFAVTVDNPLPSGVDQIDNSVSIDDDGNNGDDIDESNNNDSDDTPVSAAPDLTVSKVDQQASVNAGDVLIYDISYENIGDQDATGVVITEIVPLHTTFSVSGSSAGWVCSPNGNAGSSCTLAIGPVNAGDPAQTVQFAVLVDDTVPSGIDALNNTVSINDDGNNGDDTDPTNNDDSEPTDVVAAPDLVITKTDGGLNSGPGQTIVYTLNYENVGSQDTVGVVITETIPANTTFNAGASNPAWSCSGTTPGNSCTYFVGNLNVGDTGSVVFAVDVDDPLPQSVQQILNSVNIGDDGSNGPDEDLSNNDDDETTGLFLNPPVGVKTVEVDPSDPRLLHWTFYWYNPNNNVDLPVFIYDEIPAGTTYVPAASCTPDGTSTCTTPIYNSGLNRIELNAVISPDPGAPANETMANLANEVVIRFDTRITAGGSVSIENQAMAHWDENNNGDPNDDEQGGQQPVVTDDPTTTDVNDPTGVRTAFPIPTLSTWALLLLIALSLGLALPAIRRRS
ncbi:isopeptide-forming domain-containing fimbrial protein [Marinicella gelatinilytica]|uniref:isopeptide-forming domain-containing fimbrial protein n=1 Tax=Marinicella gelatinilytica TaxID=2996017 RepID=UPI0022609D06|nr:isopeptide-forming domain-containing fimbrial protein [Marinicella gelatinilytica]MCX7545781.1 isopeptide-forming domain-containing fimbrial protein [Marinicella gelatinilytica]